MKQEEKYTDETHRKALEELELKKGDEVIVLKEAQDYSYGWRGRWVKEMSNQVGKTLKVLSISEVNNGVQLTDNFFYPAFVLQKIPPIEAIDKKFLSTPTLEIEQNINILNTANSLVFGDREKDYGKASENFTDIAKGWEILFKTKITPEQVGLAMIWLKVCRGNNDNCSKEDTLIDIAGYAACIEKIKKNL